ncbi:MAG: acyl-CoA dehydrogenase, partial [Alphaproteobacteria bacterium]|nr:acyl-CoA dehydrogenase [Alphaproteobacteria bacterium]
VDSARLAVAEAANDGAGSRAAIVARLAATDAALRAAGEHIQILGGMGFSWESPAHLHLKRARRLAVLLGEPGALRARLATRFIDDVLRRSVKSR